MYHRLLDECGDSDILNGSSVFVDPELKFFYNVPLMMNTNARIDENLATCIIKCNMKYSNKQGGTFNKNMYHRLLDECGDSDILNGFSAFVDPPLNFSTMYH